MRPTQRKVPGAKTAPAQHFRLPASEPVIMLDPTKQCNYGLQKGPGPSHIYTTHTLRGVGGWAAEPTKKGGGGGAEGGWVGGWKKTEKLPKREEMQTKVETRFN